VLYQELSTAELGEFYLAGLADALISMRAISTRPPRRMPLPSAKPLPGIFLLTPDALEWLQRLQAVG
jgi:hypothetical protein